MVPKPDFYEYNLKQKQLIMCLGVFGGKTIVDGMHRILMKNNSRQEPEFFP